MNESHRFATIVARVRYKHPIRVGCDDGGRHWLQLAHFHPELNGRKWRLSDHMTDSEVVATAFKACLAWEEHECREAFRYRGQQVFGPHFDVDQLSNLLARNPELIDRREERKE